MQPLRILLLVVIPLSGPVVGAPQATEATDLSAAALRAIDAGRMDEAREFAERLMKVSGQSWQAKAARSDAEYINSLVALPPKKRAALRRIDTSLPNLETPHFLSPESIGTRFERTKFDLAEALKLRIADLPKGHAKISELRLLQAIATYERDPQDSVEQMRSAISSAEATLGELHPLVLGMLSRACETLVPMVNPASVWAASEVQTRRAKVFTEDSPERAWAAINYAAATFRAAQSPSWIALARQAARKGVDALKGNEQWATERALGELTLFQINLALNDQQGALAAGKAAISSFESSYGHLSDSQKSLTQLPGMMTQVADLHQRLGDTRLALQMVDRAMEIFASHPAPHYREGFSIMPLATRASIVLQTEPRERENALADLERAIDLANKFRQDSLRAAVMDRACPALLRTNSPTALARAEELLREYEELLRDSDPRAVAVSNNLATCFELTHRPDQAFDAYLANSKRLRRLIDEVVPGQSIAEMFQLAPKMHENLTGLLRSGNNADPETLFEFVWQTKGAVSSRVREVFRLCRSGEGLNISEKLDDVIVAKAEAYDLGEINNALQLLGEQAKLQRKITTLLDRDNIVTNWNVVSERFPADTTIVDIVACPAIKDPHSIEFYEAFVLSRGAEGVSVQRARVAAEKLDTQTIDAYAEVSRGIRTKRTDRVAVPTTIRKLSDSLRPILKLIPRQTRRLVVCPDGKTHRIPWCALQTDAGEYLVERHVIEFAECARNVLTEAEWQGLRSNQPIHLIGNLDYSEARQQTRRDWVPLPGSQEELRRIRKHWPSGHQLTGRQATRERVRELLESGGVVHLATHAMWSEPSDEVAQRTPLLSALLVLSDAGVRGEEISGWDLSGVDLAVLSACYGADGLALNGEGVSSLERSLRTAGVRQVLANLWRVNDAEVEQLMTYFYADLKESHSAATSLRAAQLAIIRQKKPWTEWAGWRVAR